MAEKDCFHCGLAVDQSIEPIFAQAKEIEQVCCLGCKAVTEHIYQSGLGNYYEFRSEMPSRPDNQLESDEFVVFDDVAYLDMISDTGKLENSRNIVLSVDNIHCAACAWLIEQSLFTLKGILKVNVNTVTERATIQWDLSQIKLSQILSRLSQIGYPSAPFKVTDTEQKLKEQEKQYIKRLGVAGLFTMQVMMLAIAMYFGAFSNMESHQTGYFKWISLVLSIPVIFYSAVPFLTGAIKSVKARRLNMDVPVSIAIFGAFFASLYQLLSHGLDGNQGEVFFESISMFTFLLLIGKYLEFKAKSKALLSNANLNSNLPLTINLWQDGKAQTRLVKELSVGDIVLIKPGEHLPIDGVVVEGSTSINESVLNGEFEPVTKLVGDIVLAGSINNDGSIKVKVTALDQETTLSQIAALQTEFASNKPKYSQFADRVAHWFVFAQLVIASGTYLFWHFNSPADALWISLSVLVATCPCALSLATPTAYTCILSFLNKQGILIKDALALDKVNLINDICFDKTGTLTQGKFGLSSLELIINEENIDKAEIKAAMVKLQQHSEHPIAKAFQAQSFNISPALVEQAKIENVLVVVGSGIEGSTKFGLLRIGSAAFTHQKPVHDANVYVTLNEELIARINVDDNIKPDAFNIMQECQLMNKATHMLTGDSSHHGQTVSDALGLDHYSKGCRPEQKASYIVELQHSGRHVMMVGDGINDAPVFASADVSVAMGDGADITKFGSDIIILNNKLSAISQLFTSAFRTRRIIKQNLYWSLFYNLSILPVAMAGLVPPYIAVIGMSASSILVVSNSLRLLK